MTDVTPNQPKSQSGEHPQSAGSASTGQPPSPSRKLKVASLALKIVLPVVLIAGSVSLARALIENRPEPQRQERVDAGLLVEVTAVEQSGHRLDVTAEGTVMPARQVVISPQVSGRVTWIADALAPGGLVSAEQDLVRIDDSDYDLNLDIARAELARVEAALELERGRQVVAQREWEMFADQVPDNPAGRSLALREPQEREAEQTVELAETRVRQARLSLGRTAIEAPFNAFVQSESVEVGQVVAPGTPVATLVGTDEFWVQVQVPLDKLGYFDIPGVNATEGSRAVVWQELGGQRIEREGRVTRLLPDLDPVGRMARVLVTIDDPLNLDAPPADRGVSLLLGSFVRVEIEGSRERQLIEVPRVAVREGSKVYVMTTESTLDIRTIDIAWGRPDTVLVATGLAHGERVVTSRVGTAVPGMQLRTVDSAGEAEREGNAEGAPHAQAVDAVEAPEGEGDDPTID